MMHRSDVFIVCRDSTVVSGLPSGEEGVVEEGATEVVVVVVDIQGTQPHF